MQICSSQCVNSLGLVFDIIGAWFVAWEVVRQFHGKKHEPVCIITCSDMSAGPPPVETEDFKKWEKQKYFRMKLGLAALTIGFILQILSNFI